MAPDLLYGCDYLPKSTEIKMKYTEIKMKYIPKSKCKPTETKQYLGYPN